MLGNGPEEADEARWRGECTHGEVMVTDLHAADADDRLFDDRLDGGLERVLDGVVQLVDDL